MKSPLFFLFQAFAGRPTSNVSMFRGRWLRLILLVVAPLGLSNSARAAGIEETVNGGVALGRAANYSRANDFMAILQNPANLAVIPGADLGGELRLPILNACFDRAKDGNVQYRASDSFGNVCNSASPFPTGNLGWAQSFDNGVGYGVGFFSPPGIPQSKYGKDTSVTIFPSQNETLPITESGTEWPNRYLLLSRRAVVGWLMAGIGWQPHRAFRVGASFGTGFFSLTNKSMVQVQGGSFKSQEVVNTVTANDWFLPRATVSMVAQPVDSIELFANLMYQGDANATGHSDQVANGIQGAPRTDCTDKTPGPNCRINGVKLNVPFPTFEATLGFRYAQRRRARERVLDPIKDEKWDVALEGFWSQTSHVDNFTLNLYDANLPSDQRPGIQASSDLSTTRLPVQQKVVIPHNWKDTFGARIGGDYNIVPEVFSMRVGLSYSSNAVRPGYANIDSFPMQRIGLHAGLTFAHGRQKLTLAYAHLFYSPLTVGVGDGKVPAIAAVNPQAALPVNEGYYQAMVDIISVQSNLSF